MKISKYFMEWFRIYGWLDDGWHCTDWQKLAVPRIAWRCYRKGVADTKKKYNIKEIK